MEIRRVSLSLPFDEAKEFYNSGNATLKKIALQAFTEEELTAPEYTSIKTLTDAIVALGMDKCSVHQDICSLSMLEGNLGKHLIAVYKVDIIRRVLNQDWEANLVKGDVYYPWVKFYKENKVPKDRKKDIVATFICEGVRYSLVGGDYHSYGYGLGSYCGGGGHCYAPTGLFGCKSKEIALYMSKYFAKEIFDACYAQYIDTYKWV